MKFSLTLTQKDIAPAQKKAIEALGKDLTIKGFRPGKAPFDMVKQNLKPEAVVEATINSLLPDAVAKYVTEHKLKTIGQPEIQLVKMVTDGDWEFSVEYAEPPVIDLKNYIDLVKTIKAKSSIWVPGKDSPTDTDPEKAKAERLQAILEILLANIKFDVPELLIKRETNRTLSRLISQLEQVGVSLEEYAKSSNKTVDQLKNDYQHAASENLKLEFILSEIAHEAKIEVSKEDIATYINGVKDEKTRASLAADSSAMLHIYSLLIKQKVLDHLLLL